MAVRSINPLEEHAGKVFLGAAALLAVILAWMYLAGGPTQIQLGGPMPLNTVSEEMREKTDLLRTKLAEPVKPNDKDIIQVSDDLGRFEPANPPRASLLGDIGSPVPSDTNGREPPREIKLAFDLLKAPDAPTLNGGKGTIVKSEGQPPRQFTQPIRWVVACGHIPYDSIRQFMTDLRNQAPQIPNQVPLALEMVVERQEVDDTGKPVGDPAPVGRFSNAPQSDLYRTKYPYPGEKDQVELSRWIGTMAKFKTWLETQQRNIWRAPMYQLVSGGPFIVSTLSREEQEWLDKQKAAPPADIFQPPPGPVLPTGEPAPGEPFMPAPDAPPVAPPPVAPPDGMTPPVAGQPQMPAPNPAVDNNVTVYVIDETVKPSKQYRYRLGYIIFNPALNLDNAKFAKEEDRRKVGLAGPMGPWSGVIATERDIKYFLVRGGPDPESPIEIDVFRLMDGEWKSQAARLEIGGAVGVGDFSTGMVVVDLKRESEVSLRRQALPGDPVMLMTVQTVQAVLSDAKGRLIVRNLREDIESYDYKDILEQMRMQGRPRVPPVAPAGGAASPALTPGGYRP